MCLYLSGGVEADVKLLRAAEKVWPEEIRCGRKFVEDQGKDEEMTSCPQCNCANIKRLLSVADSMDSGPFAICNLSLRLGGRVALKGKLRFPGLNFDSRVGFVVFLRCCGTMLPSEPADSIQCVILITYVAVCCQH